MMRIQKKKAIFEQISSWGMCWLSLDGENKGERTFHAAGRHKVTEA